MEGQPQRPTRKKKQSISTYHYLEHAVSLPAAAQSAQSTKMESPTPGTHLKRTVSECAPGACMQSCHMRLPSEASFQVPFAVRSKSHETCTQRVARRSYLGGKVLQRSPAVPVLQAVAGGVLLTCAALANVKGLMRKPLLAPNGACLASGPAATATLGTVSAGTLAGQPGVPRCPVLAV